MKEKNNWCKSNQSPPPTSRLKRSLSLSNVCLVKARPVLLLSVMFYMVLEYFFGQLGQLSQLCCLPTSCPPVALFTLGAEEKHRRPWHTAAIAKTLVRINTVLVTTLKHSTMWAAVKEINSIPTRPSTPRPWKPPNSVVLLFTGQIENLG